MDSRRRHRDSLHLWNWRQKRTQKSNKRTERQTDTTRPDHWQYNLGRHPELTHVAVKTWNWIDEFCLICLLVLISINFITVLLYLSLLPSIYETQSIHMECKKNVLFLLRKKKKLAPALFVNDFLFSESNNLPKVTTSRKKRPPKAANSESNEGRYYRNSTVVNET